MSDKPVIFISYSRRDQPEPPRAGETAWLDFVREFIQPVVKFGKFDLFVDEDLHGGDKLFVEIEKRVRDCDIFILLVSPYSMVSPYVEREIQIIRERQANGDSVVLYPLLIKPTPQLALDEFKDLLIRPDRPLSLLPLNEAEQAMANIANDIGKSALAIAERKRQEAEERHRAAEPAGVSVVRSILESAQRFVLPSLFLDDLQGGSDRAAGPSRIDFGRLPETPYENLVGRDMELARLDAAWEGNNTNILSLIAEGGAGKSALVNEWLKRIQADDYRGADAVLGWSFYSQGTKERATSADAFLNWAMEKLDIALNTTSATAKGDAIAEALMLRRVLLVLDGVEPLQHGPDGLMGELKDQGLRALLRGFAAAPPAEAHGLIVLTSRLAVTDIAGRKDGAAPVVDVEKLSDEAGAALLRDNGVWGTDKELKQAAHDFGGHPLALGLLASFLKETQTGDIRRRDHVGGLVSDEDNPRHGHAKRVMASYEKDWLADQPVLLAIMHLVGLFDRPASANCLKALRAVPAITGLTDAIVMLDEDAWKRAIARLRGVHLIAPPDSAAPDALDAHPLVREWFGARLKETNEAAWKTAHGRLYEHLRDTTKEGDEPSLEQLTPLYQAIAHGCRAGRYREALDDIYVKRVIREDESGKPIFYSRSMLGAFGSDLAAVSWFFEKPFVHPIAALGEGARRWLIGDCAALLRAQGRLGEALPAMRVSLEMYRNGGGSPVDVAVRASNLSETELLSGNVDAAVTAAEISVDYADRSSDEIRMMLYRTTLADAMHSAGRLKEAEHLFQDAENRQAGKLSGFPLLIAIQGYQYCDLLLATRDYASVRDRALNVYNFLAPNLSRLSKAVAPLAVGRAYFGVASVGLNTSPSDVASVAFARINEAVDSLRAAATVHHIPRGLLVRSALHRSTGDWASAARDLDEVEEIAEPGPMKLHLCDLALERARLAFAKIEAFAPLNGMIDDSPPKPVVPDEAGRKNLHDEAAKQIEIAAKLIAECGYHRRDAELAELQAVLKGEKTFASLPIHV